MWGLDAECASSSTACLFGRRQGACMSLAVHTVVVQYSRSAVHSLDFCASGLPEGRRGHSSSALRWSAARGRRPRRAHGPPSRARIHDAPAGPAAAAARQGRRGGRPVRLLRRGPHPAALPGKDAAPALALHPAPVSNARRASSPLTLHPPALANAHGLAAALPLRGLEQKGAQDAIVMRNKKAPSPLRCSAIRALSA